MACLGSVVAPGARAFCPVQRVAGAVTRNRARARARTHTHASNTRPVLLSQMALVRARQCLIAALKAKTKEEVIEVALNGINGTLPGAGAYLAQLKTKARARGAGMCGAFLHACYTGCATQRRRRGLPVFANTSRHIPGHH